MISARIFLFSILCVLFWTPLINGQDLSRYREFQFGMNLSTVAKEADMKQSQAKAVHQRPAMIQELEWRPQRSSTASLQPDPVKDVLFSFYDGELFRMVVSYDSDRTQGLTSDDMIGAISATYGTATRPTSKMISFSSAQGYSETEKVLASWEDPQYSFNLFRSSYSYKPQFGMVLFSKRLDALAGLAVAEAIRMDEREAPQREIERREKEAEEIRAAQEKARPANKANFRP